MILCDKDLREYINKGWLKIEPLYSDTIQQNGVDLRIGNQIGISRKALEIYDMRRSEAEDFFEVVEIPPDGMEIEPMSSLLLHTEERISLPPDLMAMCGLRSTIARMGFIAPATYVDAGFSGQLTIEVFWSKPYSVKLYKGVRFLHVIFAKTSDVVENPYKGSYQGQSGVKLPKTLLGE